MIEQLILDELEKSIREIKLEILEEEEEINKLICFDRDDKR